MFDLVLFLVFQFMFNRILVFDVKAIKPMLSRFKGVRLAGRWHGDIPVHCKMFSNL
jgi:hypothetical protein